MTGFKTMTRFDVGHYQVLFLKDDTVKHAAAYPESGDNTADITRRYDEGIWLKNGEYTPDAFTVELPK